MVKAHDISDEYSPISKVDGYILVIDNDPLSREIISVYLENEGYNIVGVSHGKEAWEQLEFRPEIDAIITECPKDKEMAADFVRQLKAHPFFRFIPIITHSSVGDMEVCREILRCGVFYFLTKPFDYEVLATLARTAVTRGRRQRMLLKALEYQKVSQAFTRLLEIEYKTLEEADTVAFLLAYLTPEPERMIPGLIELLVNAVEHGNLEVGFEVKGRLLKDNALEHEISERSRQLPYSERKVRVSYRRDDTQLSITITDQGKGFDVQWYQEFSKDRLTAPNGRGIAMTLAGECFDTLEYREGGREVHCVVALK